MSDQDRYFDARAIDPRVRLAMRVLEFEQTRVPTVDELAARIGLSPFHFARLFAEQVGESCAAYSRRIRLDGSNNQLIHDPVPLGVVAATFGYENQTAFNRAYVRQFGMSPTQYLATVLGRSQAEHAAGHLRPVAPAPVDPLLQERVRVVERVARPALVRRFYGHDIPDHWRRFLAELPAGLALGAQFAGLSYDNARVTPARHWRYDCAIVFERTDGSLPTFDAASGLDAVEVPGGLHAEVSREGSVKDLWCTTIGLFTEWLPKHREYRPDGDPVVHWLHSPLGDDLFVFTATIRVHPRSDQPEYNLRPLTRYGEPAGHRTALSEG